MSRTAASTALTLTRGTTWEDYLDYYEDDGVTPIELDGYVAVLQVWALEDLYTTAPTPLLELRSDGATPQLFVEAIPDSGSTVKNRVRILVDVADHAGLNPENEKKVPYGFGANVSLSGTPDYVLPYAVGKLVVLGSGVH